MTATTREPAEKARRSDITDAGGLDVGESGEPVFQRLELRLGAAVVVRDMRGRRVLTIPAEG